MEPSGIWHPRTVSNRGCLLTSGLCGGRKENGKTGEENLGKKFKQQNSNKRIP